MAMNNMAHGPSFVVGHNSIIDIGGTPVACSFRMLSYVRRHMKTGVLFKICGGIASPGRCRLLRVDHVDKFMSETENANHPAGGRHHTLSTFISPTVFKFSRRS